LEILVKMRLCLLLFLNVRVSLSLFGNLIVKMRLCLMLFLNVRVRLSLFGNLCEDESVPVDVPECEGEAAPIENFC
jgi:hypothetical protein